MNLENYLKENYLGFKKIKRIKRLGYNNINSINYLIFTNCGDYVFKKITDRSDSEKSEKMCQILEFCLKNNVKVIKPIKNKDNNYVDKKRKIYLTKYCQGSLYGSNISELREAAKILAELHKALAKNPIKYNYRTNYNYYRILTKDELEKIKNIADSKKTKDIFDKELIKNYLELKKVFLKENKINNIKAQKQLIHFDFRPENIIFKKGRVEAVLDFDAMRQGRKIEDISFASFRFASFKNNDINEIKKRMKIFIDSYLKVNKEDVSGLNNYLISTILGRLSYILRKKYFRNCNLWERDFKKNINFLKLAKKL